MSNSEISEFMAAEVRISTIMNDIVIVSATRTAIGKIVDAYTAYEKKQLGE